MSNNENEEDFILRCPICKLIPIIKSNLSENTLEYKCQNDHKEKGIFNIIYEKLKKDNNINKIKCNKCSKKAEKYCFKCFKFYCNEHLENIENHFNIDIKNIDNFCFNHNEKIVMYCKTENKLLCCDCEHEKYFCNIIPIKQLLFNKDSIENFNKKIEEIKNLNVQNENNYYQILKDLENLLINYLNKIKEIKKNFEKNNNFNIFYSFFRDLFESYKYKTKTKNYNFNLIKNLSNNFNNEKNINDFSFLFDELQKNIKKIEFNHDKISFDKNVPKIIFIEKNKNFDDFDNFFNLNNSQEINCMKILKDKRLAIGNESSILTIFNNSTFEIDIKINNNLHELFCIEQLKKNGNLCLSFKTTIRILTLSKKSFKIIQDIKNAHDSEIWQVKELYNNFIISCSHDKHLKIWTFNHAENKYTKSFTLKENNYFNDILETKPNEIIFDVYECLVFFNVKEKKQIEKINDLNLTCAGRGNSMILINENVVIGGEKKIYFVDINNYSINKVINCDFNVYSICLFKQKQFLVGDRNGKLIQFNYDDNQPVSIKNHPHNDKIYSIVIFNDFVISAGKDKIVKFWK